MKRLVKLIGLFIVLGCVVSCRPATPKTAHDLINDAVTEDYVEDHVRPLSDPVALAAHNPNDLPQQLLDSNRILSIEFIPRTMRVYDPDKNPTTVYTSHTIDRPANSGMITGVPNARLIGVYYPKTLDQPEIEVRMNYSCDVCGHIAVHLIAPNPLLVDNTAQ